MEYGADEHGWHPTTKIGKLLHHEATPGVLLALAAALALYADNSVFAGWYDSILSVPFTISLGDAGLSKALLLWINDGLMAIFFFLVGLEIKREVKAGKLSSLRTATLPAVAAVGGMAAPAVIYALINMNTPETLDGWAIPAATDIAFALGALALLGSRVPASLKVFLLALAVLDDLGAIVIIALFYTANLSLGALVVAGIGLVALIAMNLLGVRKISPYVLIGVVIWVAVLKSGVHATLAGVAIAFTIPLTKSGEDEAPLVKLEHLLHPWVAFFILPVFAFANAGVPLSGLSFSDFLAPVPLGIALGLILGKPIGIFACAYGAVRLGFASLPSGVTWMQVYGVSHLAGIGFTMSLFIGTLAFGDPALQSAVRLGVLGGSAVSIILGMGVLWAAIRSRAAEDARALA